MISDLEILKSDKDSMNIGLGNIISHYKKFITCRNYF